MRVISCLSLLLAAVLADNWVPLKIHPVYEDMIDAYTGQPMSNSLKNLITDLIDVALKMYENSVRVRDFGVQGHLPNCNQGFSKKADGTAVCLKSAWGSVDDLLSNKVCYGSGRSGQGFDGRPYFKAMTVCDRHSSRCDEDTHQCSDSCTVAPAGDGVVEGANFYLYVNSFYSSSCQGSTLAYAGACYHGVTIGEPEFGRPDHGYTNICPDKVSLDMTDNEKAGMINTIWHEIAHAIAFGDGLMTFYVNPDGSPKVGREFPSLGLLSEPTETRTVQCFDGENTMTDVFASSDVLCVTNKRGHPVHMVCSPEVQRVAREITGCDTVEGAELNWLPSTMSATTCYGTHWSAYVFNNAVMNAASLSTDETPDNYMKLTFALMVDSGWYQVDYRFAQGNPWTDNKGCSFMDEPCVVGGQVSNDNWCLDNGHNGCDPNHFQAKQCSYRTNFPYADPGCTGLDKNTCLANREKFCNWVNNRCQFYIYPWLSHETSDGGNAFGSSKYMEYCPYRSTILSNRVCVDASMSGPDYYGHIYGRSSRCMISTAINRQYQDVTEGTAGCYEVECAADLMSYQIFAVDPVDGSRLSATCSQDFQTVELGGNFKGSVECPERSVICPNACPNGCSGKGTCQTVNGVPTCLCLTGHTGNDCGGFDIDGWMATDWKGMAESSDDSGDSGSNTGGDTDPTDPTDPVVCATCAVCASGTTTSTDVDSDGCRVCECIEVCSDCDACPEGTESTGAVDSSGCSTCECTAVDTGNSGDCEDFATSEAEAQALGNNGCLMQFSGWGSNEFCGQYTLATCTDAQWGADYSTCCPVFCGTCSAAAETSPAPTNEPTRPADPVTTVPEATDTPEGECADCVFTCPDGSTPAFSFVGTCLVCTCPDSGANTEAPTSSTTSMSTEEPTSMPSPTMTTDEPTSIPSPTMTTDEPTSMPTMTTDEPTSMPTMTFDESTYMPSQTMTTDEPTSMPTMTFDESTSMPSPTMTFDESTSMPSQTMTTDEPTSMPSPTRVRTTDEPTSMPSPSSSDSQFFLMTGNCDAQGDCVSSGNYPNPHENNENCVIIMLDDASLTVGAVFDIELGYDHLTIRNVDIQSLNAVPSTLNTGEVFTWTSDSNVSKAGWQVCFEEISDPTDSGSGSCAELISSWNSGCVNSDESACASNWRCLWTPATESTGAPETTTTEQPTSMPSPTRVKTSGTPETTRVSTGDCIGIISSWDMNCAYTDASSCDADWMCQWTAPDAQTWMPSNSPTQTPAEMPSARRQTTDAPTGMPSARRRTTDAPTGMPSARRRTTDAPTGMPSARRRTTDAPTGMPSARRRTTDAPTGMPSQTRVRTSEVPETTTPREVRPTSMPTPTRVRTSAVPETTTVDPTSMPSPAPTSGAPETTGITYLEPDSGMLDSIQRLLERNFSDSRMTSVGQRASALLQEKDENTGEKLAQQYDPEVKGHLQRMRGLWKSGVLTEENWNKMINQYNKVADILGRTRVE